MQLPLRLQLKPSRTYLAFLASGHILAGVAAFLLPLPNLLRLALVVLLGLLLLRQWRVFSRNQPSVLLRRDGKVEVQFYDASLELATVGPDALIWPWLVVLPLQVESGAGRSLLLFPDSLMGHDSHRQLRLWLRWASEVQTN